MLLGLAGWRVNLQWNYISIKNRWYSTDLYTSLIQVVKVLV